jgi:hypothetical protein
MRRNSVVICSPSSFANGATSSPIAAGVDERLVALHVDDDVAVERRGDFGESIGAGFVRGLGQPDLAAEIVDARRDAQIVGRDDDFGHGAGRFRAPIHVLDHRTAVEIGENFSGEPRRSVSGGDDGDDSERRNRIDF